jgi:hypothetical protein
VTLCRRSRERRSHFGSSALQKIPDEANADEMARLL